MSLIFQVTGKPHILKLCGVYLSRLSDKSAYVALVTPLMKYGSLYDLLINQDSANYRYKQGQEFNFIAGAPSNPIAFLIQLLMCFPVMILQGERTTKQCIGEDGYAGSRGSPFASSRERDPSGSGMSESPGR